MKSDDALRTLAARLGIAAEYTDIWGHSHPTPDETLRRLLKAMQVPLDQSDAATCLQQFDQQSWQYILPPVCIACRDTPSTLRIQLPAAEARRKHQWVVLCEDSSRIEGSFTPAQLPLLGKYSVNGKSLQAFELTLPGITSLGYHTFHLLRPTDSQSAEMPLIVCPAACYQPQAIQETGRVWGPGVQLYGLRSRRNWGIGDFTDLHELVDITADAGGGIVGVNPLHALFPDTPERISPYSPSSRSFTNVLYIDIAAIPEFHECGAAQALAGTSRFQAQLRSLRADKLVNYPEVYRIKHEMLGLIWRHFCDHHLSAHSARGQAFSAFQIAGGGLLETQARFEALQAHFREQNPHCWGWPVWPDAFQDPSAAEVSEFAETHRDAVDFQAWQQWLADSQLAAVGQRSWQRGLGVGLYVDLAVGVSPDGAEAWRWQQVLAMQAHVGAPPDEFNQLGQDWGLPPWIPHRLRENAYQPLIEMLRANMRHAGALRIDHAMGLARLYWVPAGMSASEGAYVSYPLQELLGIVALESQRNQCLVIGEDLGTVPNGLREQLRASGLLSYHPFLFERNVQGGFSAPADYPRQALVCVSTHDLPTLSGFWQGSDLDTRAALGLFASTEQRDAAVITRAQDRAHLLMALAREQLLPEGGSVHPVTVPELTTPYLQAVHAYLARTPAQVLIVQPEDILGQKEQANLPGSQDHQHPNWQRRLALDLEDWHSDSRFTQTAQAFRQERGSAVTPHAEIEHTLPKAIIPRATYRLQFNQHFTFNHACELIPYLAALGISHCYASPYLKARPGSSHGYDIVDHATLNPEVGTREEYERFVTTLHVHGMGQILDMVPNHMGIMGNDNNWWLDVLENGPASDFGNFFDIDWDPINPDLKGKVLLPILGSHYGAVLNNGELQLDFDTERGEFNLFYYQHRLPIDPASYPQILSLQQDRLARAMTPQHECLIELQSLMNAFARLPDRTAKLPEQVAERQRDKEVHKRHLCALHSRSEDIARHIQDNLREFNGTTGEPASFDLLHALIQAQGYRLAYWRVASDEINYRRFFDINDLAALRMEEESVFNATHHFVLDLINQGKVEGLRIDHPDGLYDPGSYFGRLQQRVAGRPLGPEERPPLYLLIEKILAEHERLPESWPIHGATGYRFANLTNALFVDASAERRMSRIYHDFSGDESNFDELVYHAKKLIMDTALASERNVLAHQLWHIAAASRDTCDFTLNGLRDALTEVVACFPVYRTYITPQGMSVDDRRHIDWAVGLAKKRNPAADTSIFDFIREVLTTDIAQGRGEPYAGQILTFAMKFQQFSSPVMAKGLEDTSFYRYHRLTSLNDVGADPRRFGILPGAYHTATRNRAQRLPHNLLASSTHDSKRSEDVRARINVLSEIPAAWKLMLKRWSRINRTRKRKLDGLLVPSASDEYLLYQTLIGTWPLEPLEQIDWDAYRQRIQTYMTKAVREAKLHSSWVNVNAEYESALNDFVAALLVPSDNNLFLTDFTQAMERIIRFGLINSLGMTLLKLTAPGVPDIYQGSELWQLTLVDPDNRQEIDFRTRQSILQSLQNDFDMPPEQWKELLRPLVQNMEDGRIKLYLIWRALTLRQHWREVFDTGEYLPLNAHGACAEHLFAFMRCQGEQRLIVAVSRLNAKRHDDALQFGSDWQDTGLCWPETDVKRQWQDALSGQVHLQQGLNRLSAAHLFAHLPVALLVSDGGNTQYSDILSARQVRRG